MNTQKHVLGIAIATALSTPQLAAAETLIDETVVTATRVEQSVDNSLAAVSVITAVDIERLQATDIQELLRRLPGIDTDSNGGRGTTTAIRVRGTDSDQVVILVDGIRTASATSGATAIAHLPVSQIERIEVVRGPLSGLYGADAVGGVIQIFTRSGKNAESGFNPSIGVETGSHSHQRATIGTVGLVGNTDYNLNLSYESTDGIDRTLNSSGFDRDKDGFREKSISASINHNFDSGSHLGARYLRSESSSDFDSSGPAVYESINETIGLYGQTVLSQELSIKARVGEYLDRGTTLSAFPSIFETTRLDGSLQLDYQLNDTHTLVAGLDYYDDKVDSTSNFTQQSRDNKGVFVQHLGAFGRYQTQVSVRRDDNQAYGNNTTGNLALGFEFSEETLLTVSYGEAFKAPTFNDLYFPFQDYGYSTYQGNPDLSPEESKSYEARLRSETGGVHWSLSAYKTDVKNMINGFVNVGGSAYTALNIDSAELQGLEATTSFDVLGWHTDIGLTYLSAHNGQTDERLDHRPRTKATVDLTRSFGAVNVAINWLAQGNRKDSGTVLGGYNLVDLMVSYPFNEQLKIGANVKNLFDTDYTLVTGYRTYQTEGRTASVFARYNF